MKISLMVFIAVVTLGASCKKKIDPQTGLPAATQTGAGTFAAHVDSESWSGGFDTPPFQMHVATSYLANNVLCVTLQADNNATYPGFQIYIKQPITQGQVRSLQTSTTNPDSIRLSISHNGKYSDYYVIPPLTGQATITKYDATNKILSGTFSCDMINAATGDKKQVRDAWFDVKL